ncbi:MAG: cache domain-containing protein [Proteobacteria bacterium]|nr:cache domain-containing protein [Pseudomonadota bacterium]
MLFVAGISVAAVAAAARASREDAVTLVRQGEAHVAAVGKDKAYAEFTDPDNGDWHKGDLYLVVYALDGTVFAHGANPKMVGKNVIDLRDVDGKLFVRERLDKARSQASFWHNYKFTNPETGRVEPKQMYCERFDGTLVCGGVYR